MSLSTQLLLRLLATQSAPTPYEAGAQAKAEIDLHLPDGSGTSQANLLAQKEIVIPAASTVSQDLRALTDAYGAALAGLDDVALLLIEADDSNVWPISIGPSAANGWTSLLADPSDRIVLYRGSSVLLVAPRQNHAPVDATHKSLDFVNGSATSAITVRLTLIGRAI